MFDIAVILKRIDLPTKEGQVPETLDNRGGDALDGERTEKISGMVR